MHRASFRLSVLCVALLASSCTSDSGAPIETGSGGNNTPASGGASGAGGVSSNGGSSSSGGAVGSGGAKSSGGSPSSGGAVGSGGFAATGGVKSSGGATTITGSGGGSGPAGGTIASGGQAGKGSGGAPGSGGKVTGTGGVGSGGSTSTGTGVGPDCNAEMPTTGGSETCGRNTSGKLGDQNWDLWCNAASSSGCITTYSSGAFSARWSNNNDFLARVGLEFGNAGKTYDNYGTLKADFAFKKSGSGGGYSYLGIYGWTNNPCVEWYIVDDRYGTMPFNAYNATQKGTAKIDGSDYKLFQNKTNGTGGSRCSGVTQWDQYWSIRQTARQCGTITISEHFKAWEGAGLQMGGLLEAKILVETGGGTGNIDFPIAKVTAQ